MNKSIKHFFNDKTNTKSYSYSKFVEIIETKILDENYNLLSDEDKNRLDIIKINFQRLKRIEKTFTKAVSSGKINTQLVEIISKIDVPQTWLVITEDWCGDSAQNIPYFFEYAKLNKNINVKIILRDENLDLLESYFTSGNPKSIPKIIGFNNDGNEIFIWGARPKVAQDLVMKLKAEGLDKDEFNKKLHLWYGRDRGKELEKEIIELLK